MIIFFHIGSHNCVHLANELCCMCEQWINRIMNTFSNIFNIIYHLLLIRIMFICAQFFFFFFFVFIMFFIIIILIRLFICFLPLWKMITLARKYHLPVIHSLIPSVSVLILFFYIFFFSIIYTGIFKKALQPNNNNNEKERKKKVKR